MEPHDASDPKAVADAKARAGRIQKADDGVLKNLLALPEGRAFVYRRLAAMHIFETSFTPGEPDKTAFKLGEQNIGLQLLAQIVKVDPDAYVLMMKEQQDE